MTIDRRNMMKLMGLGALGVVGAAITRGAEAPSTSNTGPLGLTNLSDPVVLRRARIQAMNLEGHARDAELAPEVLGLGLEPKSRLGELLVVDHVPDVCLARYDVGGNPVVYYWNERDKTVVLVPTYEPFPDEESEEKAILAMLRAASAHATRIGCPSMVTACGGRLNAVALDLACNDVEDHDLSVAAFIASPKAMDRADKSFRHLFSDNLFIDAEDEFVRPLQLRWPSHKLLGTSMPDREFRLILSDSVPMREAYVVGEPDMLGVYAIHKGGIGMAVLCGKAVARINVL